MRKSWIIAFLLPSWLIGRVINEKPPTAGLAEKAYSAFLAPIARIYLDLFNSPTTALTLCACMIAVAGGLFLYYFLGQILPTLRDLKKIDFDLRPITIGSCNFEKFRLLDEVMLRHQRVARPWKLYCATFKEDGEHHINATSSPSRYLNMKALEQSGLKLRFFFGLPNDFVALGLIFTFLGLVAGLYFASQSMLSSNIADARNALTMLLHAATFKFLTSITGIAISMIMAGAQRIITEKLQAGLDELQYIIEERIPPGNYFLNPTSVQEALKRKETLNKNPLLRGSI